MKEDIGFVICAALIVLGLIAEVFGWIVILIILRFWVFGRARKRHGRSS